MDKQELFNILAEVCQEDVVKENPDIDLFEEGLLDSFGTINLLVEIEGRLGITVPITEFTREEWNTPNNIAAKLAEME
ncbi:D-alanine--poly(phosphoribitol) ligase subunit 2 [Heyndrickxia sporothermodurans]|uniref:D-alanyl carrier protein n=1 Tax=Heyndrickxia sporothermodurans TaxID=46224 RepID=A0A150L2V6_9BACI|nr:D-alanine--poly(phosphoribitol) ligase subunit 2 [Heyndrickxia sporothermodurans]KYD06655.1 D-alanine--poly(phosphoribitol) ligase subunit 2 [Heyndrickxia sporothermodurans]MBL5766255.1 D-alanine--poly(phosphoribitol) ligase subunit 2 [Heyndrickxia sporothermodurans]MBL5769695.1 D-alanine--poly(phosphoribitol) ligase subunit 2 [Heyndrickxia sporothermodurans]MBL5773591.1 D-alanine--poly(phosphoribitol) ligase subunit 2 [Heyndrickxia sporothermodurans]MBL5776802.1 D-alanine--poly(phosphoribi